MMAQTPMTMTMLAERLSSEAADGELSVELVVPTWLEYGKHTLGAKSALVVCDLLVRDDGSCVLLDAHPSNEALMISQYHMKGAHKLVPWAQYVADFRESLVSGVKPSWLPKVP